MDPLDITQNLDAEQERAELDAKIYELEISLTLLKRRRNALSSISKIPSDILLLIFKCVIGYDGHLQILDLDERGIEEANRLQLAWIRSITHVWSTWRDFALDSPSLWTRIRVNSGHKIVLEMLKRSRSLPLTISFMCLPVGGDLETFESVILKPSHIQRIKHLELGLLRYCARRVVTIPEFSTIVNLESLSVSITSGSSYYPFVIPVELLRYSSDTLCSLQMSNCTVGMTGIDGILSLRNLLDLTLRGPFSDITTLLHRLSIPQTCMVTLDGSGSLDNDASQNLGDSIQRIWRNETAPCFSTFTLRLQVDIDIYFLGCFAIDETESSADNLVIQNFSLDYFSLETRLNTFPFEHIQTLRIEWSLELELWRLLVRYCPNITSLSLRDDDPASWLGGILYIHDPSQPSSTSPPVSDGEGDVLVNQKAFPNLQRLDLMTCRLDHLTRVGLLDCVKQRFELGIPIKRLTLQGIKSSYLQALNPYVDGEIIHHVFP
ncbi:hypothetical protein BDN72DRAFT_850537 [Pluteus cervinus]|uniref:Uncharacterized protein n=1 Tax=Pluteus cervinus TaxID=181527 RepID=A0ACD3A4F9_9AGAR|nr:hypothetical protein BDN72DRAFT_850537 [Pluteus cervinus]